MIGRVRTAVLVAAFGASAQACTSLSEVSLVAHGQGAGGATGSGGGAGANGGHGGTGGESPPVCGTAPAALWARSVGGDNLDLVYGVAADDAESVYLTGQTYSSVVDVGGVALPAPPETANDMILAKLDRDGSVVWGRRLGGPLLQRGRGVATSGDELWCAGTFNGTIDLGACPAQPGCLTYGDSPQSPTADAYVEKMSTDGATFLFDGVYDSTAAPDDAMGGSPTQTATSIIVDGLGGAIFAGTYEGDLDLGGGLALPWLPFAVTAFVARLGPGGATVWGTAIQGDAMTQTCDKGTEPCSGLALHASGDVLWAGYYSYAGSGAGSAVHWSAGGAVTTRDVPACVMGGLLARLGGATGAPVWTWAPVLCGPSASLQWADVAYSAADDTLVAVGSLTGTVTWPGGTVLTANDPDIVVAKFSAEDGSEVWVRAWSATNVQAANSVAYDPEGDTIYVGGEQKSDIEFGDGCPPLAGKSGASDAFLLALDGDGDRLWSASFGDQDEQHIDGVEVTPAGRVIAFGGNAGRIDFGAAGALIRAGSQEDAFVVVFPAPERGPGAAARGAR